MKNIIVICILCIFLCAHSTAQQNFGLCLSEVHQMYQHCTNRSPLGSSVGTVVTGRRIGKNGPRGEKGMPGLVNDTVIDAAIEIKLEEIEARFDEKLAKYEKKIIVELISILDKTDNCNAISYKNKCYVPVMDQTATFDGALEICAGMSGKLANIYDETHLNLLMSRIREDYMNGKTRVMLRLGMTIQPSTGKVTLADGSDAEYLKWHAGYPLPIATYTTLILMVRQSESSISQYMHQYTPSYSGFNLLCEI